jgi:choline dehydrogenase
VLAGLIYPESRGSVTLRSADPLDRPLIDPAYLADERDMDALLAGCRLARRFAETEPLAQYIVDEAFPGKQAQTDDEMRAHIRLSGRTIYHPVGTCKMGNDELAVVDHELRVRGIDGLRVADASIMPRIVGGNTNAPAIMIGEKVSDMIKAARSG